MPKKQSDNTYFALPARLCKYGVLMEKKIGLCVLIAKKTQQASNYTLKRIKMINYTALDEATNKEYLKKNWCQIYTSNQCVFLYKSDSAPADNCEHLQIIFYYLFNIILWVLVVSKTTYYVMFAQ